MLGFFNPSITQRLNNLAENINGEINTTSTPLILGDGRSYEDLKKELTPE